MRVYLDSVLIIYLIDQNAVWGTPDQRLACSKSLRRDFE